MNKFQPIPVDTVTAHKSMTSLAVAKSLGLSLWNLKYLNPQYKGLYPEFPKNGKFYLPAGMSEKYEAVKTSIKSSGSSGSDYSGSSDGSPPKYVRIKSGQTLWDISKRYGVSMKTILRKNNITYQSARFLRPGRKIYLR